MRTIKLSMLAAMMLTLGITSAKAQTADEIMEKHATAIGGTDNWNKLKTVRMTGSMTQQGYDISMVQTLDLSKGVRIDISVMGMNGYQIITSTGGWAYMPMMGSTKIDTMKADAAKMTWEKMDIKGHQLLDYKSKGIKVALDGKDTINNALCYKIKCTTKDGDESTSYIDVNTYYLLRTESKVKVNDEEQEVATVFSNYQKQEGNVVMPMTMSIAGGEITYKTIEINKPVDQAIFMPTMPAPSAK